MTELETELKTLQANLAKEVEAKKVATDEFNEIREQLNAKEKTRRTSQG